MTHFNLIHVNFPSQGKPNPTQPPAPSLKNLPIKKGEGGIIPLNSHNEWKENFLGGGEYISIPLRSREKEGGMLKIPRQEIVACMEKLYSQRVMINPNESQQGIYEEAKRLVISRYLKKEGLGRIKNKFPKPSWVNPKYR